MEVEVRILAECNVDCITVVLLFPTRLIQMLHIWVTVLSLLAVTTGLDNGLGLTPPMGILFRCTVNCDNFPDGCLKWFPLSSSEDLVRSTADKFAEDGYQDAGYEYIILGDCVVSKERDTNGKLQPDPNRFPSGFKNLSDYVSDQLSDPMPIHSKGLKFGMYTNYGTSTCAGYPALIGHMEQDIKQFASEWEVDYLKVDNCNTDYSTDIQGETRQESGDVIFIAGYTEVGRLLNETGRPVYLQCEWPGNEPDWSSIPALCNSWRTYIDIVDGYTNLVKIVEYMAENQDTFVPLAGPGHWNDPDVVSCSQESDTESEEDVMTRVGGTDNVSEGDCITCYQPVFGQSQLTVGNKAMLRSWQQMTLWSVMASPLIMSTKLDELGGGDETMLKNKDVIAVNQDPLGRMGRRIFWNSSHEVWTRPISPVVGEQTSYALVFTFSTPGQDTTVWTTSLGKYGLDNSAGYVVKVVYSSPRSVSEEFLGLESEITGS
uniref:Alpha-galactosidase n=1 Tax=Timema monikensis TaxID=170555 RepID=A0A7R9HN19_9NEOP|nr:unnamed protein product [Timema monikensis]